MQKEFQTPAESITKGQEDQPEEVRDATEPVGLQNVGNTCYLNSLL